jgi:hypothetical protein
MATTGLVELAVFITHYIYSRRKMNINVQVFSKKNMTYIILSLLFIPISLLLRKLNLGFYITMILIIITCMLLYFIVLYIKKDNNLMFILDKFKNKSIKSTGGGFLGPDSLIIEESRKMIPQIVEDRNKLSTFQQVFNSLLFVISLG